MDVLEKALQRATGNSSDMLNGFGSKFAASWRIIRFCQENTSAAREDIERLIVVGTIASSGRGISTVADFIISEISDGENEINGINSLVFWAGVDAVFADYSFISEEFPADIIDAVTLHDTVLARLNADMIRLHGRVKDALNAPEPKRDPEVSYYALGELEATRMMFWALAGEFSD